MHCSSCPTSAIVIRRDTPYGDVWPCDGGDGGRRRTFAVYGNTCSRLPCTSGRDAAAQVSNERFVSDVYATKTIKINLVSPTAGGVGWGLLSRLASDEKSRWYLFNLFCRSVFSFPARTHAKTRYKHPGFVCVGTRRYTARNIPLPPPLVPESSKR